MKALIGCRPNIIRICLNYLSFNLFLVSILNSVKQELVESGGFVAKRQENFL